MKIDFDFDSICWRWLFGYCAKKGPPSISMIIPGWGCISASFQLVNGCCYVCFKTLWWKHIYIHTYIYSMIYIYIQIIYIYNFSSAFFVSPNMMVFQKSACSVQGKPNWIIRWTRLLWNAFVPSHEIRLLLENGFPTMVYHFPTIVEHNAQ